MYRAAPLALALAVAASFAACGGGGEAGESAQAARVQIKTFQFKPDPLKVKAGTTVTFENLDGTDHTVTAGPRDKPTGEFDATIAKGEKFERKFDMAGTYQYVCTLHPGPGMEGEIVVE